MYAASREEGEVWQEHVARLVGFKAFDAHLVYWVIGEGVVDFVFGRFLEMLELSEQARKGRKKPTSYTWTQPFDLPWPVAWNLELRQ